MPKNRFSSEGSSPHVRGALDEADDFQRVNGIIPACAGSTGQGRVAGTERGDHPRMCGEHYGEFAVHVTIRGIIPACAGSTRPLTYATARLRDHPRMCGEHCQILWFLRR